MVATTGVMGDNLKPDLEVNGRIGSINSVTSSVKMFAPVKPFKATHGERTNWVSLATVDFMSFLIAINYSVYMTSVWPYLLEVSENDVSQVFFGFVIAAYAIAQGFSAPTLGYWANRSRKCRPPILVGVSLMIAGNVIYVCAGLCPQVASRKWMVLVARMICGAGSGATPVVRSYAATACLPQDKDKSISLCAAAASVGRALGPALMVIFSPLGPDGFTVLGLPVNQFTAPELVSIVTLSILLITLFTVFREEYAGIVPEHTKNDKYFVLRPPDRLALVVCLVIWFTAQCMQMTAETILTAYTMIIYGWTNAEASTKTGELMFLSLILSTIGFFVYALTPVKRFDSRKSVAFGLVCFMIYYLLTYPWPFFTGTIPLPSDNSWLDSNSTTAASVVTTTPVPRGCDLSVYSWCTWTPVVPKEVLYPGFIIFFGIGWVPVIVSISILYSKILGPRRQGLMLGLMTQTGSLAKTVAPPTLSFVFETYGPGATWLLNLGLLGLASLALVAFARRLVPLKVELQNGDKINYNRGKRGGKGTLYRL